MKLLYKIRMFSFIGSADYGKKDKHDIDCVCVSLTVSCVCNFLDCRIRNGENGIHFLLNRDGKRRGDAFIELESEQDVQKALEKHWKYMGQRYVEGMFNPNSSVLKVACIY